MKLAFPVLSAALIVTAACSSGPKPLTLMQRTAITDSARMVLSGVISSSDKLDFASAVQLFSADSDAHFAENGTLYPSRAAMQDAYNAMSPMLDSLDYAADSWDITPLSEDAAAFSVPIHLRVKGKTRPTYTGQSVWTGVVQRRQGRWSIVQSHESWMNATEAMAAIAPLPEKAAPVKAVPTKTNAAKHPAPRKKPAPAPHRGGSAKRGGGR